MARKPNTFPVLSGDIPEKLFHPEVLLVKQYYGQLRNIHYAQGEKRLMSAILEDAIDCFQKYLWARDNRSRSLRLEAELWLLSDDDNWPFSFVNVCGALDFEFLAIRRGLMAWKERELGRRPGDSGKAV